MGVYLISDLDVIVIYIYLGRYAYYFHCISRLMMVTAELNKHESKLTILLCLGYSIHYSIIYTCCNFRDNSFCVFIFVTHSIELTYPITCTQLYYHYQIWSAALLSILEYCL